MKAIIFGGLSILLTGALSIPPAAAESTATKYAIQPVTLVHLGYQGYFESRGIPGNLRFLTDGQSGKVTAVKLVRAAIEVKRLPPEAIEDANYLNGVQNALQATIEHG
jgi:hypothetical protein